ncbi:MAG: helix-turn-helix domain-containing protein [Treponema lecithinolyticum]|uniref:helix-turn-helix domain-containing protein n=1 Tax=Treponema lecithinolyticum TaxID=53418 RepID=UPI00360E9498
MAEMSGLDKELHSLPPILSVTETAQFLYLSESTVYRLIYAQKLRAFHADGMTWNILKDDIASFCKNHETI